VLLADWRSGFILALRQDLLLIVTCAVFAIAAFLLLILGPKLGIAAFSDFRFAKRPRFQIPKDFHRRNVLAQDFAMLAENKARRHK
jgi:hypothetical protein